MILFQQNILGGNGGTLIRLFLILIFFYHFDIQIFQHIINLVQKKSTYLGGTYYNPSVHRKLNVSNTFQSEFECDVIFIGHYEDDGQAEVLEKLAAENFKVKILDQMVLQRSQAGLIQSRNQYL
jgi:hypothetical protein